MRTNINQGRIQSLAVMIVMLINNDQTPYLTYYRILGLTVHATSTHCFQLPSPRSPENLSVMKSSRYPVLLESFWQSHSGYPLYGINAAISAIADKKEDLNKALMRRLKSAILSRMPSRHAAYTVYQLYFTPSMP